MILLDDVLNHYSYDGGNPNTSATDPLFRMINRNTVSETSSTLPREIQLGMKVIW